MDHHDHGWTRPSRLSGMIFAAKVNAHRARRAVHDLGSGLKRLPRAEGARPAKVIGECVTDLWPLDHGGERAHQLGKTHNLRRAARALDRLVLGAGETFSFWKHVGKATAARGFAVGRMLQEGCMVPAIGGGLCQLSNALYEVALQAGCVILERHGHSQIVPGSAAATGRDATVAWNYVDLRFATSRDLELEVRLTADDLIVRLLAHDEAAITAPIVLKALAGAPPSREARSCASCNETECFMHEGKAVQAKGRTAFLVDEAWPEFRRYVERAHGTDDVLGRPTFAGPQGRAWSLAGFARTSDAALAAAQRSLAIRRLSAQGPARRTAEINGAERIAAAYARLLTPDVERVVVAQGLLPYLWRDGHLGGRRFEVLMSRLPIGELQARLDAAAARHPDRRTLSDFRASPELAALEAEALAAAEAIVTPHADIAALFGGRAHRLDWATPPVRQTPSPAGPVIAFPGPTAARKGAWEVREAARRLGLTVLLLGSELEGADFWAGVETRRPADGEDWTQSVSAVVQPALVEDQPRKLLAALAAGLPVIATPGCGLPRQPGLTLIRPGDPDRLVATIEAALASSRVLEDA